MNTISFCDMLVGGFFLFLKAILLIGLLLFLLLGFCRGLRLRHLFLARQCNLDPGECSHLIYRYADQANRHFKTRVQLDRDEDDDVFFSVGGITFVYFYPDKHNREVLHIRMSDGQRFHLHYRGGKLQTCKEINPCFPLCVAPAKLFAEDELPPLFVNRANELLEQVKLMSFIRRR